MMGKVENIEGIITTTKNNNESSRLKFEISDGRLVSFSTLNFLEI